LPNYRFREKSLPLWEISEKMIIIWFYRYCCGVDGILLITDLFSPILPVKCEHCNMLCWFYLSSCFIGFNVAAAMLMLFYLMNSFTILLLILFRFVLILFHAIL
jgi:hypothetical protein